MKRAALLLLAGCLLSTVGAMAAAPAPPEAEKEGTVAGTPIARADGGWLGLELKDGSFQITFYDAKKKPVAADRSSAVLTWNVHYQPNPERTLLLPGGDPAVLSSPYHVKAPHAFTLH